MQRRRTSGDTDATGCLWRCELPITAILPYPSVRARADNVAQQSITTLFFGATKCKTGAAPGGAMSAAEALAFVQEVAPENLSALIEAAATKQG